MDIDTAKIRTLLDKRDELDAELAALFAGTTIKKTITCSNCREPGHSARSCSKAKVE